MNIELPRNASKKQVADAIKKLQGSIKKKKLNKGITKLFGSNKSEVDGLAFQKKVRKEWD